MAQSPTKKQQAQLKKMKKLLSQKINPRMTPAEKAKFKGRRREHKAPVVSGKGRWAEGATKTAALAALMAALSKTKYGKAAVPALKKLLAKAAAAKVNLAGTALVVSKKYPGIKQVFPGRAGAKVAAEGAAEKRAVLNKLNQKLGREVEAGIITPEQAYKVIMQNEPAIKSRQAEAVLREIIGATIRRGGK